MACEYRALPRMPFGILCPHAPGHSSQGNLSTKCEQYAPAVPSGIPLSACAAVIVVLVVVLVAE